MSIIRSQYGHEVTCDDCGDVMEVPKHEAVDIKDVAEVIKAEGWTIIYEDGEFEHHCCNCQLDVVL